MKSLLLFLAITFSGLCFGQSVPKDKQLYSVNIFRWSLDSDGNLTDTIIYIDKDGNITYNGEKSNTKLNMGIVTDGFNKFIEGEKVEKTPAYGDDENQAAHDPEKGEQALHITIVRMEDYLRDKDKFTYPSEYFRLIVLPVGESPNELYKYMSADLVSALGKMLK
jgi:hypothetical protein